MAKEILKCTQSANTDSYQPDLNDYPSNSLSVQKFTSGESRVYLQFENKANIRCKKISEISIKLFCTTKSQTETSENIRMVIRPLEKSWNQKTITWNTKPDVWGDFSNISYTEIAQGNYAAFPFGKNVLSGDFRTFTKILSFGVEVSQQANDGRFATFMPSTAASPPQLEMTLDDVDFFANSPAPVGGAINANEQQVFSWVPTYDHNWVIDDLSQKAFKFKWRAFDSDEITEIYRATNQSSLSIPAGTFEASKVQWQVQLQSNDDVWGTESEWFTIDVLNEIPTPIIASPQNEYVDGAMPQNFIWSYGFPAVQTKCEIAYSLNGVDYATLNSQEGTGTEYVVPAHTIPSGRVFWRLRSYNNSGQASPWSKAAQIIVNNSAPPPWNLEVSNNARPTMTWLSRGQVSSGLSIADLSGKIVYENSEIPGPIPQYIIPEFLKNGEYIFSLRVKNVGLNWSAWIKKQIKISVSTPSKPTISTEAIKNGVRISVRCEDCLVLYLLRNEIPVAKIENGFYDDYAAIGICKYMVRAVDQYGGFADSDPAVVKISIKGAVIAPIDALQDMLSVECSRDRLAPQFSGSVDKTGSPVYFLGRTYPVYIFGNHLKERFQIEFATRRQEDKHAYSSIIRSKEPILYRDNYGNRYYGVIVSDDFDEDFVNAGHNLTVERVDYQEKVLFD